MNKDNLKTKSINLHIQYIYIYKEMINNIVEDVLNVMQLLDVQHSLVGNVEKRGISGLDLLEHA